MTTRDDWTMAALGAIARGGVAAVAVDVLATELGISRGSFYWHFANREALLVAAMEMWEQKGTAEIIEGLEGIPDPRARLRALFAEAFGDEGVVGLEPALLANADHPAVAPVLARVTERRIGLLGELYEGLGLPSEDARRCAIEAYATYLGWMELRRAAPQVVPEVAGVDEAGREALDHMVERLLRVP